MDALPFIDEYREPIAAPREAAWAALLQLLRGPGRGTSRFARLLGCDPAEGSAAFEGRPGEAVPGFRVVAAEPGRRLDLRGRHRFARYALTFELGDGEIRARTNAEFPGVKGRLYRAAVIGSGGHRVITRAILRRIARAARVGSVSEPRGGTMSEATGTVRLHRLIKAPPARIYKAFLDPNAMAKWLPPHGFTGRVHEMDARVGGGYRMSFTNLGTGHSHSFGDTYLELVPNERIRNTDRFDDPNLPGEMVVTVDLRAVTGGTELSITQEGIPAVIPVEMCYLGWQESLQLLTQLVESEIPDGA